MWFNGWMVWWSGGRCPATGTISFQLNVPSIHIRQQKHQFSITSRLKMQDSGQIRKQYQCLNSKDQEMAKLLLTWQRLMFRSYGGPTHRNVTSPRDRKMTSHHYSPRRTPLPSPTADPAPEALLTRSQFPTLSRQFIATIGTFEATRFF